MGDWVYWLSWVLSIVLACAMVYLAWWALFHDRPNGRRRCPRCWYDLTYAPEPPPAAHVAAVCSECGFTAKRVKQLYRTRRRYAHAALAFLVCLGLAIFAQDRTADRGWSATMPTRVLLLSLPFADYQSAFYQELAGRAEGKQLSESQLELLIKRCARGDTLAPPLSDEWRRKYGTLILNLRSSLVPQAGDEARSMDDAYTAAERHLLSLPCVIEIGTPRERWPRNETAWVAVALQEWWPADSEVRLEISPRGAEASRRIVHYLAVTDRFGTTQLPLLTVEQDAGELVFDIEAFHRRGSHTPWRSVSRQVESIAFSAAEADETLIEPITDDDERIAAAIRQTFRGQVVKWQSGESPVRFSYMPYLAALREFDDLAVGASLELRRGEELARRIELWWLAGGERPAPPYRTRRRMVLNHDVGYTIVYENMALLAELDEEDERWQMHVRGEERIALRVPGATRYWSGELQLPVTVSDRAGESPRRPVRIE